ncbi:MAG: acetyl ornithine aminotransferase family protein [Planctomycetota bacterium]|nr:acetyl ornithine aminotransferase family protein [Planctomycetota bacterium]MDA1178355.1 acetyl ornithine aminotransferase family protein [Planctomycetota bacterium]
MATNSTSSEGNPKFALNAVSPGPVDGFHDASRDWWQSPSPRLVTSLPGPRSKQLIELDQAYTSPSYTRDYPLTVARARGAMIEDLDGNLFLDFTAGIAVCSTGHCHPQVVKAIQDQAAQLIHMSGTDFYYEPQARLAQRLAQLMPGRGSHRVFFANSGTESVEAALKLARYHTGRSHIIGFQGGFHGRTMGALSVTASKPVQRQGFGPLLPQVSHVPFGNCYRCPCRLQYDSCDIACVKDIETNLFSHTVPPQEVAAFLVEPIQGEGGYIIPPPEYHVRLKQLAERHGILYIADEVQSGIGRTGKMFAIEHWGVEPDIMCVAKGIASGMPLGAIVARSEVMTWPPGSHASTFGGNPIACAAALATIDLVEQELMHNAQQVGEILLNQLRARQSSFDSMGDIRGRGLMIGVECIRSGVARQPDPDLRNRVIQACFRRGLLLLGCGPNSIRFCPPLIITVEQAISAVDIFCAAFAECQA